MTGFIFEKFGEHFCHELYPEKTVQVQHFLVQFHPPDRESRKQTLSNTCPCHNLSQIKQVSFDPPDLWQTHNQKFRMF